MRDTTISAPDAAWASRLPGRPTAAFVWSHPAHAVALGFGAGLAPRAPGTVGTLWAWAAWAVLAPVLHDAHWGGVLLVSCAVGWWACTVTARRLRVADPGCIVWDEIVAFWLVLWLIAPCGLGAQAAAFALFRYFDAAKPGPVGWADRRYKLVRAEDVPGWRQGWGILFDDLVAAGCSLLVIAAWRVAWAAWTR